MPLFGPPNVAKLEAKRDVKGLIQALAYPKDSTVRVAAAEALDRLGWRPPGHDRFQHQCIRRTNTGACNFQC